METKKIHELFRYLGLNEKEINVYLSLYALGSAPVSDIAKKAGIKRTNTYNHLKKLQKYGFISMFTENKKTIFRALGVESISDYLDQHIQLLDHWRSNINDLSRELATMKQERIFSSPQVIVFEGKQAALHVWHDMLRMPPGESIYDIEASHYLYDPSRNPVEDVKDSDFFHFARRRIEKCIPIRFISTTPPEYRDKLKQMGLMRYSDAVYVKPEDWPLPIEMGAYGNKFYVLTYDLAHPLTFIIENQHAASAFKLLFEIYRERALTLPHAKHVVVN